MTNQLSIYNGALLLTGSRRLVTLSDSVESRRILDDIWDSGNGVKHCLEQGFWKHAMRTQQVDYSSSITPPFGFRRAYDKPTDLVKLYSLCTDEYFNWPVGNYQDEGNYWFSDYDTMYVRYVSNDNDYGMDYSLWPESFTRFVEAYFADRSIKRLTDAKSDAEDLREQFMRLKTEARSNDAMKEPNGATVPTGWQLARVGESYRRRNHPYR